ncbi:MAG: TIGR02206 family membrane protein [Acidobacteriota bacterium]|nr:TIGR02206 family membrane protein [Acidobacteriota bacterium]
MATEQNFQLFGPIHLGILGSIVALAALLAAIARRFTRWRARLRTGVALTLLLNAIVWYAYLAFRGWLTFPDSLPFELCDATLGVTVIASFTLNRIAFDLAYYGTLAGTSMALITPDLWEPFPSFSTVQFFVAHGLVVVAVLFLVWSQQARPRPGSVWRAMLGLNLFAAFAGAFDFVFRTNYMYLHAKPQNRSLLDYLGPWPWYILSSEILALVLFTLLYLPFKRWHGARPSPKEGF